MLKLLKKRIGEALVKTCLSDNENFLRDGCVGFDVKESFTIGLADGEILFAREVFELMDEAEADLNELLRSIDGLLKSIAEGSPTDLVRDAGVLRRIRSNF